MIDVIITIIIPNYFSYHHLYSLNRNFDFKLVFPSFFLTSLGGPNGNKLSYVLHNPCYLRSAGIVV